MYKYKFTGKEELKGWMIKLKFSQMILVIAVKVLAAGILLFFVFLSWFIWFVPFHPPTLQILSEWFGRSVIRSCVKLSYDHAQSMIEAPKKMFSAKELPPVDPEHPIDEIHQAVLNLHSIAKNLRAQRFSGGALRLDQVRHRLPCFWLFCVICPLSFSTSCTTHHDSSVREYHASKLLSQL